MLKKFDFYAQFTIIAFSALSAIASIFQSGYLLFAVFMLLPLGLWQLISAACITFRSTVPGIKRILQNYWIASSMCLVIFFTAFLFRDNATNDLALGIATIALSGCFLTALYYLYLYKKYLLHAKPTEEDGSIGSV